MPNETNRFLVILRMGSATQERLGEVVRPFQEMLQWMSTEPIEQTFRSVTADIFGYVLRSRLPVGVIRANLESPGKKSWQHGPEPPVQYPFLNNEDDLLILEIGEEFSASQGFSRVGIWLQLH